MLVLTAKDVPNAAYANIEMTVAKDRMVPLQLKYFNAEGANIRCNGEPVVYRLPPVLGPRLEHDPEKLAPGFDPGWNPVFRKACPRA